MPGMGENQDTRDHEQEAETHRNSSPSIDDAAPTGLQTALSKEPDIPAVAAPISNSEDILEIGRGRRTSSQSQSSHASKDSDATHPDIDHDHQTPPHRDRSRAQSSARSARREAVKVARKDRRGLFARFTVVAEITDPYAYSRRLKWWLTFVISVAGSAAPMATSIILPALVDITRDFDSTATVVNLSVALYMLSMSIFPLWWSSFSETLGRRTIYLTSFALYFVFNVVAAISTSIGMFIAMRLLSGGAAASVQAVGAGTIADIWESKERGQAMGIFYLGPLCGPLIAPIMGGVMAQSLGWRSVQWFLSIYGAVILVFIFFALPETLGDPKGISTLSDEEEPEEQPSSSTPNPADEKHTPSPQPARPTSTLTRQPTNKSALHLKTTTYLTVLRRWFIDPLKIILYLKYPPIALCVGYASILFGALYALNVSVQQTFSVAPYGYSSAIVGLLYIPNSLGYFLSSIFGGRWVDSIMAREARKAGRYDDKGRLIYRPEDRMKENAWLGALMFPAALLVYGWTAHFGIHLAAPMIAGFFFGVGSMLIFAMVTTMLTEFMPRKSSNGVALNNFVRNIFSCVCSVITNPLIETIGNGWLFTILALVPLVVGVWAIWAMKRFGPKWRVAMEEKMNREEG